MDREQIRASYPFPYPCRVDENSRAVHCRTCDEAPMYLAKITRLQGAIDRVLALHHKITTEGKLPDYCSTCGPWKPWPCETVRVGEAK